MTKQKKVAMWIGLAAFVLLIIAADQLVKYLVVQSIPLYGKVSVLDGVLHLTLVRNDGAAFSMLGGSRWLFVAVCVVFFVALGVLIRKKIISKPFELWALAAITGGAVGNLIDRIAIGSVVDMFEVEFVQFAVFNVADIFVTCGAAALIIYIIFFDRRKKDSSHDADVQ